MHLQLENSKKPMEKKLKKARGMELDLAGK
jgi:hypothetical protein